MSGRSANRALASRMHSESGATLIQVAVMIVVLSGFSALVLDQGVMWLARVQAQNAADAGALAGALARAFDETTPPVAGGLAETSARTTALSNTVGTSGGVTGVTVGWTCPTFALGSPGVAGPRCARVDVFRDGTNSSTPLPTFFANVFAVTSQPVRASATAWVANTATASCMRPFAIADRWSEKGPVPPYNQLGEFNRWRSMGPGAVQIPTPDVYLPPTTTSTGTGYTVTADVGTLVTIKVNNGSSAITPGWFLALQVPKTVDAVTGLPTSYTNGASEYQAAIKTCVSKPVSIGQYLPLETGAMVGPTAQGTMTDGDSLYNKDPGATWVGGVGGSVSGGCVPACGALSPRIVPITVFDLDEYQWRVIANNWTNEWIPGVGPGGGNFTCPGGKCVRVANIVGVFITGMVMGDVQGRIVRYPGQFVANVPNIAVGASFLTSVQLIR
ncbi:MAG: pilus assembly protein TadG-related protein [Vicinamibacterales bacterium]